VPGCGNEASTAEIRVFLLERSNKELAEGIE
jgi:hypothetical protein